MRGSGMSGHGQFALLGGAAVIVGLALLVWASPYPPSAHLYLSSSVNIRTDSTGRGWWAAACPPSYRVGQ